MKKTLSLILAVLFIFSTMSALTVVSFAGEESQIFYTLSEDKKFYTITDCKDTVFGDITIPSTYKKLPVTAIADEAFAGCISLKSVTIPNSVTSIGAKAFKDCVTLAKVKIGSGVRHIGENAFENTAVLKSAKNRINGVTYFGKYLIALTGTIENDELEYYIKPGTLCIADGAFKNYTDIGIFWLVLNDELKAIGNNAFYGCSEIMGVNINKELTTIGENAFLGCTYLDYVVIPSTVTEIGAHAFGFKLPNKLNIYSKQKGFTIEAVKDSAAAKYASSNRITFVETSDKLDTPTLVSAYSTAGGVAIKWNEVKFADGYDIYRKTADGKWKWIDCAYGKTTKYVDEEAKTHLKSYTYTVRAYNSLTRSGYVKAGITAKYVAAPVLKSVKNMSNGIVLSWTAVEGASKYIIYRKTGSGKWENIGFTNSTKLIVSDTKVTCGEKYTYTVRAVVGKLNGAYNTKGLSIVFLNIPKISSAKSGLLGITLKYSKIDGAEGYRIYRKTADTKWELIATTSRTTFTDKDARADVEYFYTVRAYSGKSLSNYNPGVPCKK